MNYGRRSAAFLGFYLSFLSGIFTIHRSAGKAGGYLFNSSLAFPPTSQTLIKPSDYCREVTPGHSY